MHELIDCRPGVEGLLERIEGEIGASELDTRQSHIRRAWVMTKAT